MDEEVGLHMLQLKGSKQASKRACPFPRNPNYAIYGKGCPDPGDLKDGHTCLNGNKEYDTLQEAWTACGEVAECAAVMEHSNHKYYLRRANDPDMAVDEGSYMLGYHCTHEEELQEQARRQELEEQHKLEEERQQEEDRLHNEEIREMRVSDDQHAVFQEKFISSAWSEYMKEGGLSDKPSKDAVEVQKDITRDFSALFSHFMNTDCGWDTKDENCQMGNQAYINNQTRNATGILKDDVFSSCGRICEEAGAACGGFSYKEGSETCYFRQNTRCGVKAETYTSCFTKKITRHGADLKEERANVLREIEDHHSLYVKTENHDCGWSDSSKRCGMDNQAWISSGERDIPLISPDEVVNVCGLICKEAGDVCGGFTYKLETKTCHFRKNTTCGVYEMGGTNCYTKKEMMPRHHAVHNATAKNITEHDASSDPEASEASESTAETPDAEAAATEPAAVDPAAAASFYEPIVTQAPAPAVVQDFATGVNLAPGTVAW